jgi:glycosyltransferase involved in cell wall biosynthesis
LRVLIFRSRAIDSAVYKIAEILSKNGYSVELIIWDRKGKTRKQLLNGYSVYYFGLNAPYDELAAILYLPFWWLFEFLYILSSHADVIHFCDLDTILPFIFIKKLKKRKCLYTIYDFYADNLPVFFPSILRKLISRLELSYISITDGTFIVDEHRYSQINKSKIKNLKIIYNSPPDLLDVHNKCKNIPKHSFTIFYAGVIHKTRGIATLLEAIRDLYDVALIVAGTGGSYFKEFLNMSANLGNVQYLGQIKYEEVLHSTLFSELIVALYDPSIPNNRFASPNKLFEAMMCGKPIIVNEGTCMAEIVRKENCGLVVPYGDVEALKRAILVVKNDPVFATLLGLNGRKAYETTYSWKIMEDRLLNLYKTVLKL